MSTFVKIDPATSPLADLIANLHPGDEILFGYEENQPVARLSSVPSQQKAPRPLGQWAGKIWIADDFDADLPEDMLAEWYDNPIEPEDTHKPVQGCG